MNKYAKNMPMNGEVKNCIIFLPPPNGNFMEKRPYKNKNNG